MRKIKGLIWKLGNYIVTTKGYWKDSIVYEVDGLTCLMNKEHFHAKAKQIITEQK